MTNQSSSRQWMLVHKQGHVYHHKLLWIATLSFYKPIDLSSALMKYGIPSSSANLTLFFSANLDSVTYKLTAPIINVIENPNMREIERTWYSSMLSIQLSMLLNIDWLIIFLNSLQDKLIGFSKERKLEQSLVYIFCYFNHYLLLLFLLMTIELSEKRVLLTENSSSLLKVSHLLD